MHEMSDVARVAGLPSAFVINNVSMCTLTLPCQHAFNISAIAWHMTRNSMLCPVCRQGDAGLLDVHRSLPGSVHGAFLQRSVENMSDSDSESEGTDGTTVEIEIVGGGNGQNIIDYVLNGMLPLTPQHNLDANAFVLACHSRLAQYIHVKFTLEQTLDGEVREGVREVTGFAYRSPEVRIRSQDPEALMTFGRENGLFVPFCMQRKTQRDLRAFFDALRQCPTSHARYKISIALPSLTELRAMQSNVNNVNIPNNGFFTSDALSIPDAPHYMTHLNTMPADPEPVRCRIHNEMFSMARVRHNFCRAHANAQGVNSEYNLALASNFLVYLMDIHNLAVL